MKFVNAEVQLGETVVPEGLDPCLPEQVLRQFNFGDAECQF